VSKKVWIGCLSAVTLIGIAMVGAQGQTAAPPAAAKPAAGAAAPAAAAPAAGAAMTPQARVDATPKGQLKNPYKDSDAAVVAAGKDFYFHAGCNGCHGGGGGGGMCPPLTNDIWVYGGDDDTLFRLVTLGSDALQAKGYMRMGMEHVVGPMPPMGAIVPTDDALWKILTFVRSKYTGSAPCKFGCPVDAPPPG
jgi:mono/diheme cytochrome c family protein